jgi:hypothetical protein
MSYEKTILCLANSRKISGRCIAGREIVDAGYGGWVRPVSVREHGEISEHDRRYEDGSRAQVLDIIKIRFSSRRAHPFQPENHAIDASHYWVKAGVGTYDDVLALVEPLADDLWLNGYSTYHGGNDKIPETQCNNLGASLRLIRPENLRICVASESGFQANPGKRRVRAVFDYCGGAYRLQITDPIVETRFLAGKNGEFPIDEAVLCISLSELFSGATYKLVATVLSPAIERGA